jgi:D-mannonate dehydratase
MVVAAAVQMMQQMRHLAGMHILTLCYGFAAVTALKWVQAHALLYLSYLMGFYKAAQHCRVHQHTSSNESTQ